MAKQTGHGGTHHGQRTRRQNETEGHFTQLPIFDVTPAEPRDGDTWILNDAGTYKLQVMTPAGIKSVTLS